jgi:hypothetical protein
VEGRIEDRSTQGVVVMGIQVRGSDERRTVDSPRVLTQRGCSRPEDCFERYTPQRTASQVVPTVAQILSRSDGASAV